VHKKKRKRETDKVQLEYKEDNGSEIYSKDTGGEKQFLREASGTILSHQRLRNSGYSNYYYEQGGGGGG